MRNKQDGKKNLLLYAEPTHGVESLMTHDHH